jgi:hypothetical protein
VAFLLPAVAAGAVAFAGGRGGGLFGVFIAHHNAGGGRGGAEITGCAIAG